MPGHASTELGASAPFHFHAALLVFDSWAPARDYPDLMGEVRCCGLPVVMREGAVMVCEKCDTAIERVESLGDRWRILRVKGRAYGELMPAFNWPAAES